MMLFRFAVVICHLTGKQIATLLWALISPTLTPLESTVLVFASPHLLGNDQLPCRSSPFSDSLFPSTGEEVPSEDLLVPNDGGFKFHKETPNLTDRSKNSFPGLGDRLRADVRGGSPSAVTHEEKPTNCQSSQGLKALEHIEWVLMSEDMNPVASENTLPKHIIQSISLPESHSLRLSSGDLSPSIPGHEYDHPLEESQLGSSYRARKSRNHGQKLTVNFGASSHPRYPPGHHDLHSSYPTTSQMKPPTDRDSQSCALKDHETINCHEFKMMHSIGNQNFNRSVNLKGPNPQEGRSTMMDSLWGDFNLGCPSSCDSVDLPASISQSGKRHAKQAKLSPEGVDLLDTQKERQHSKQKVLDNENHTLLTENHSQESGKRSFHCAIVPYSPENGNIFQDGITGHQSKHHIKDATKNSQLSINGTPVFSRGGLNFKQARVHFRIKERKDFILESCDSKVFAWIGSLPVKHDGPECEMMKRILFECIKSISLAQKFGKKTILNEVEVDNHKLLHYEQVLSSIEDLLKQVWCLNRHFLERFQVKTSEFLYNEEQIKLQDWIRDSVLFSDDYLNKISNNVPESERSEQSLFDIQKLISNLAYHKSNGTIWKIKINCVSKQLSQFSSRWILINKAALKIICLYYKSLNKDKWEVFFPSDIAFIHFMARIKSYLYLNKRINIKKPNNYQLNLILPWEKTFSELQILKLYEFLNSQMIYFNEDSEYIYSHVHEFNERTNPNTNTSTTTKTLNSK